MADRFSTQNLNRTLTDFAVEGIRPGAMFDIEKIFPVVRVTTTNGKFYKFGNAEGVRDDYDLRRAPNSESQEIRRSYTEDNYACEQIGLREPVSDEEMDNADRAAIDPEQDAMALVTKKIKLYRIRKLLGIIFSATYMTNNGGASYAWNAEENVDIEADIDTAKQAVRKNAGVEPNTIVIPPHIAVVMKRNSTLRDLIKHTDPTLLVNGELPKVVFNLEVHIPTTIYDSANPGVATPSMAFAASANNVLVAYVEKEAPGKRSMSLGYTFRRPIAGSMDIAGFKYRDDGKHCTYVEGLMEEDQKVVSAACGYLLTACYS
jgi:hypothetical protein